MTKQVGEAAPKDQAPERLSSQAVRDLLFRDDGTLRFISYCKPSTTRGAVISVSCKVRDLPRVVTAVTTDNKDFSVAYQLAVTALAEGLGVAADTELVRDLISTRNDFLARNELALKHVEYMQVVKLDAAVEPSAKYIDVAWKPPTAAQVESEQSVASWRINRAERAIMKVMAAESADHADPALRQLESQVALLGFEHFRTAPSLALEQLDHCLEGVSEHVRSPKSKLSADQVVRLLGMTRMIAMLASARQTSEIDRPPGAPTV